MKRYMIALAALLLFLAGAGRAEAPGRKMTLMIYMCGSSLENDNGSATLDLAEITAACAGNSDLTVLAMLGGSGKWRSKYDPEQLTLVEIGARGSRRIGEIPRRNMGLRDTLALLLREGVDRFPAEEYALILWDHGGGPLIGVCRDDLFAGDMLTLGELTGALEDAAVPRKLSWIGFDACLMASLEVGLAVAPYAEYMIASEETEPAFGWDYSFLSRIHGGVSGGETGRMIVDAYLAQPADARYVRTLSCLDLSGAEALRQAAEDLFAELTSQLDSGSFSWFSNARRSAADIGGESTGSDYDLVDLSDLARQYSGRAPDQAAALREAVRRAVYSGGGADRACGLSIYAPLFNRAAFQAEWRAEYEEMNLLPAYTRYIGRYAEIWLGGLLADWQLLSCGAEEPGEDGSQSVFLELTDEQLDHYASARVVILRETGGLDTYQKVYEIGGVTLRDHTLRACYRFDGLYILDENGELITDSYPFSEQDGFWYVTAMLETESMADLIYSVKAGTGRTEDSRSQLVRLVFRESDNPGELELVNIVPYTADGQIHLGRQELTFNPDVWSWLFFIESGLPLRAVRDENGRLLPVSEWERTAEKDFRTRDLVDGDGRVVPYGEALERYAAAEENIGLYHMWGEVNLEKAWKARLLPGQKSGLNLYAQFIVTDTQGNESATELIPLRNQASVSAADFDEPVITEPSVRVRLTRTELISAELDAGMAFRFHVENDTVRAYRLSLKNPAVNGTGVPEVLSSFQQIAPESEADIYIRLPVGSFPPLPDGRIHTVSFIPELTDQGNGKLIRGSRITVSPEADCSMLDVRTAWEDEPAETLGEKKENGIVFRIVGLEEAENGSLNGKLRLINESGQDQVLNFTPVGRETLPSVLVNGCFLANCMQIFGEIALPAGSELYTDFTIRRAPAADDFATGEDAPDLFDYWGIRSVGSVGLYFCMFSGPDDPAAAGADGQPVLLVTIPLGTPLELTRAAGGSPEPLPLLRMGETEVSLRGVGKNLKTLRLLMDVRNASGQQLVFAAAECRINGTDVEAVLRKESWHERSWITFVPKGVSERVLAALSIPWSLMNEPLETVEMTLVLQDGEGNRADRRVVLSVSEERDGEYRFALIE